MTIKTQADKAKAAALFAKITKRNSQGLAKTVRIPGSAGKVYSVILSHDSRLKAVSVQCDLFTPVGFIPCPQGPYGLCYHSLAALNVAMQDLGHTNLAWTDTATVACNLRNIGDRRVYRVVSRHIKDAQTRFKKSRYLVFK